MCVMLSAFAMTQTGKLVSAKMNKVRQQAQKFSSVVDYLKIKQEKNVDDFVKEYVAYEGNNKNKIEKELKSFMEKERLPLRTAMNYSGEYFKYTHIKGNNFYTVCGLVGKITDNKKAQKLLITAFKNMGSTPGTAIYNEEASNSYSDKKGYMDVCFDVPFEGETIYKIKPKNDENPTPKTDLNGCLINKIYSSKQELENETKGIEYPSATCAYVKKGEDEVQKYYYSANDKKWLLWRIAGDDEGSGDTHSGVWKIKLIGIRDRNSNKYYTSGDAYVKDETFSVIECLHILNIGIIKYMMIGIQKKTIVPQQGIINVLKRVMGLY